MCKRNRKMKMKHSTAHTPCKQECWLLWWIFLSQKPSYTLPSAEAAQQHQHPKWVKREQKTKIYNERPNEEQHLVVPSISADTSSLMFVVFTEIRTREVKRIFHLFFQWFDCSLCAQVTDWLCVCCVLCVKERGCGSIAFFVHAHQLMHHHSFTTIATAVVVAAIAILDDDDVSLVNWTNVQRYIFLFILSFSIHFRLVLCLCPCLPACLPVLYASRWLVYIVNKSASLQSKCNNKTIEAACTEPINSESNFLSCERVSEFGMVYTMGTRRRERWREKEKS